MTEQSESYGLIADFVGREVARINGRNILLKDKIRETCELASRTGLERFRAEFEETAGNLDQLQKEYKMFFLDLLEKYNVTSPEDLDDSKRKEFFDEIRDNWMKKKSKDKKREDDDEDEDEDDDDEERSSIQTARFQLFADEKQGRGNHTEWLIASLLRFQGKKLHIELSLPDGRVANGLLPVDRKDFMRFLMSNRNVGAPYYISYVETGSKHLIVSPTPKENWSPRETPIRNERILSDRLREYAEREEEKAKARGKGAAFVAADFLKAMGKEVLKIFSAERAKVPGPVL